MKVLTRRICLALMIVAIGCSGIFTAVRQGTVYAEAEPGIEQAGPVTADPPSGTVTAATYVTLTTATVGAAVYYTLDESEPLSSSTHVLYTVPIYIDRDTVIKAAAAKDGLEAGQTAVFAYTVAPPELNPRTNNITDYNLDQNLIGPGRWSYLNLGSTVNLLKKGGESTKFAADEWALDVNNNNHVWFVKANGKVGTDTRPIAFNYTVSGDQVGKTLRLQGTYSASGSGHFRILRTADNNPNAVSGSYETLFEYTGTTASFEVSTVAQAGEDILFVSDTHKSWWSPSTINATIVTENVPRVKEVTATPDSGAYPAGTALQAELATPTAGADIYYTTDGSSPLVSPTKSIYTGPIPLNEDTVIQAVAVKAGMEASEPVTFKYFVKTAFNNFNGINQGPDQNLVGKMAWNRLDFSWSAIEPQKGVISQSALNEFKRRVLEAKRNGITIIPVLDYTAPWAANRDSYSYTHHGFTYEIGPVLSEQNGKFTRQVVTRNASGQVTETKTRDFNIVMTPPKDVEDWKSYVRLVVSTFSAAPYNLEYFQIWNEAHPESGFWYGGLDPYMETIHLPAAEIIHEYGRKTVYGGWICGAPVNEYIDLLDRHEAWSTVDVFDMHYMPVSAMNQVYNAAVNRGIAHPYVWQTEIGFSLNNKFIADTYPRAFFWALQHQAQGEPDQFKLFYFAHWAPDDPAAYGYGRSLYSGVNLTPKGRTLEAMSRLLDGAVTEAYSSFNTSPFLKPELNENLSSAEGFKIDGKRIVLAVHLKNQGDANIFVDWNETGDTLHLGLDSSVMTAEFQGIDSSWTVRRVDLYGNETPLAWSGSGANGGLQTVVPVRDTNAEVRAVNASGNETIFYIVAERP